VLNRYSIWECKLVLQPSHNRKLYDCVNGQETKEAYKNTAWNSRRNKGKTIIFFVSWFVDSVLLVVFLLIITTMWRGIVVSTIRCYARGRGLNLPWFGFKETRSFFCQTSDYDVVHVKNICKICIFKFNIWFSVIAVIHKKLPFLLIDAFEIQKW